jgi:hypothetical protein
MASEIPIRRVRMKVENTVKQATRRGSSMELIETFRNFLTEE